MTNKLITGKVYAIKLYGKTIPTGSLASAVHNARSLSLRYKKIMVSVLDETGVLQMKYKRGLRVRY